MFFINSMQSVGNTTKNAVLHLNGHNISSLPENGRTAHCVWRWDRSWFHSDFELSRSFVVMTSTVPRPLPIYISTRMQRQLDTSTRDAITNLNLLIDCTYNGQTLFCVNLSHRAEMQHNQFNNKKTIRYRKLKELYVALACFSSSILLWSTVLN